MKNIAILCDNLTILKEVENSFPDNKYLIYYSHFKKTSLSDVINFLKQNDCIEFYCSFKKFKTKNKTLSQKFHKIKSYSSTKKIIIINDTNKKLKIKNTYDYARINSTRKDANPKETISKIKKILKEQNYKVKEKYIRKNFNNSYSIRLELNDHKGSNGKGITLNLAKASAYAELMERMQSNMLYKNTKTITNINRKKSLYLPLLNNASAAYKKEFFKQDDKYFNTEQLLNIKDNNYYEIPINAVNCFCHTNGLASGNSKEEAITQGIFEILERHCYYTLLNSNRPVKNININNYPLTKSNKQLLDKFQKLGYHYFLKDCSLGKYPTVGFLLYNQDMSKYTFTIATDYSFNIALSRCITEMLQGLKIKDLNDKMLELKDLEQLNKKYKKNYKSYNWLKCFNNNIGYLSKNFFNNKYIQLKDLPFKSYIVDNNEVLNLLKQDIEYDIFIKDYNTLGFDTYRIYIPYITAVDCYDIDDLIVNKNYNKLQKIYLNINKASKKDLNFFIDTFMPINKQLKYDELIKPSDLFHVNESTDYYKLDFTSLLLILSLLVDKEKDLTDLLTYKIKNFNLSTIKIITYKTIINVLSNKQIYNIKNPEIEEYIKKITNNPKEYLLSLNPYTIEQTLITNKKV